MLPDATIFNSNINPRKASSGATYSSSADRSGPRRIEVAREARGVTDLQLQNTSARSCSTSSAFIDVQRAQDSSSRTSRWPPSTIILHQHRARAIRRPGGGELARSRLTALQFQNDVRSRDTNWRRRFTGSARCSADRCEPDRGHRELRRDTAALRPDALQQQALQLRPDLKALQRDQARSAADVAPSWLRGTSTTPSAPIPSAAGPILVERRRVGPLLGAPLPFFNKNQGEIEHVRQEARQAEAPSTRSDRHHSDLRSAWKRYTTTHGSSTRSSSRCSRRRATCATPPRTAIAGEAAHRTARRATNIQRHDAGYNEARAEFARSLYTLDALTEEPAHKVEQQNTRRRRARLRDRARRMP